MSEVEILAALGRARLLVATGGEDVNPVLYEEIPRTETGKPNIPRDKMDTLIFANYNGPELDICRGMQMRAVTFGWKLDQHLPDNDPDYRHNVDGYWSIKDNHHLVTFTPGSNLFSIYGAELQAPSGHHQAVSREKPGRQLIVTGAAPDGTIEAMEDPSHPFRILSQTHFEHLNQNKIFEAAAKVARRRVHPVAVFPARRPRVPA
jgi:putative glutamine amidotransferase